MYHWLKIFKPQPNMNQIYHKSWLLRYPSFPPRLRTRRVRDGQRLRDWSWWEEFDDEDSMWIMMEHMIYIYIYYIICIYTYINTHTHIYIYDNIYIYINVLYVYLYIYIFVYLYIYIHVYMNEYCIWVNSESMLRMI